MVYLFSLPILFSIIHQETLSPIMSNAITILFAFFINDSLFFTQDKYVWQKRLFSFFVAGILPPLPPGPFYPP
ncbi:hypothetical protein ACEF16_11435, partial [Streptococcus thoraltensis]